MKAVCWLLLLSLSALTAAGGCMFVPRTQLTGSQGRAKALTEQNRAQLAEIENLKVHTRNVEDQLMRTEEELALLEEELGLDHRQLVNYEKERAELHEQFKDLAGGQSRLPPEVGRQLVELSGKYPGLHFDPTTGISKLDTDVLFDSGEAQLKPGAERVITEFVRVLKGPEAAGLKVLVVGHTDDQRIAGGPTRHKFANNFHLSTARAHAVADLMRHQGFREERMGVAGFGPHQPVAPNVSPKDRQKNRRVEIFVMTPDVPVVGWTESIPSVYR